ncbi:MAG TPA: gliding motility-associated C-terminal domain-containing protein, partial [Saprospiraceae bacterium]|nr:gliding motility-associated C-terminal domain-containing protein [Saprospiraceae bacterium]
DFRVYNRWGQLVYDNETPDTGWDGTFDGKPQPSDVYFYIIGYRLLNGFEPKPLKGDVTLLR